MASNKNAQFHFPAKTDASLFEKTKWRGNISKGHFQKYVLKDTLYYNVEQTKEAKEILTCGVLLSGQQCTILSKHISIVSLRLLLYKTKQKSL